MTQKQIKCSEWKTRRPKTAEFERRAVLSGYDHFSRTSMDNSRARLIAQMVNQTDGYPQNEFASYYYGSQYNHPKYSVTSHAAYSPDCRKRTTISSYPSMVGLKWNSNIEASSGEDFPTDMTYTHTFKCKCDNCRMKYCRAANPSSNTLKPTFKDNIMTFSDKETMTLKLRDAFCAAYSTPGTPKMSEVSITSYARNIDTEPENYNNYEPIPILKTQNSYKCERCGYRKEKNVDVIHQPERDIECDYQECVKPRLIIKSIFKRRNEKPIEVEVPQKTLYNEGINDVIANRFPLTHRVIPPPVNLNNDSRVPSSIPSMSLPNKLNIPYSHRNQSKYHSTCKKSSTRLKCDDNDELKNIVASPEVIRRCCTSKPVRNPIVSNIKLPRRVLTSERDIESYVDKSSRGHSAKEKKRKWY